jgi:hypothetical protein
VAAAEGGLPLGSELPELAEVPWRPLADERSLRRADRRWTLWLLAQELPLLATAAGLPLLSPVLIPMSLIALAFAWFIPDLWAAKGAEVLRPPRIGGASTPAAELRALGLLGDLVSHDARELLTRTGLRVQCYCVRARGDDLPLSDRIAHLLLALRADERGFATVANLSFSGARWRLARKLAEPGRTGLGAAVQSARRSAARQVSISA